MRRDSECVVSATIDGEKRFPFLDVGRQMRGRPGQLGDGTAMQRLSGPRRGDFRRLGSGGAEQGDGKGEA